MYKMYVPIGDFAGFLHEIVTPLSTRQIKKGPFLSFGKNPEKTKKAIHEYTISWYNIFTTKQGGKGNGHED